MGAIFEIVLQLLAGVGLVWVGDKVIPEKTSTTPVGISTWGPVKIGIFILTMAIGGFLLVFLSKKLGLKLFKSKR